MFSIKFDFYGCKITLSFSFLVLITALLLADDIGATLYGVLAAEIHELGHIFAMTLKQSKPQRINLRAFSIDIVDANRVRKDYNSDVFILLAGPTLNVLFGVILYLLHGLLEVVWLRAFANANLFLAIFNLLPIEQLDGGQIVYNLLLRKLSAKNAERVSFFVSFIVLFPLAILGFYILLLSKYNFSLLFFSVFLMCNLLKSKTWYY